ncbi:hypothetical protein BJX76DRAFT_337448 [Aspergillus varians]
MDSISRVDRIIPTFTRLHYLWTQLATFEVAIISIRKVAISIYLLRVPECNMVTVEG